MSHASIVLRWCLGGAVAVAMSAIVSAQPPAARVRDAVARTPDGRPDLQGIWDYRSATPLERPREFADKAFFTEAEARAFEQRTAERRDGIVAVHPAFWLDYGSSVQPDLRTSLIVDPATGRVPALTPAARARVAAEAAAAARGLADGPEDRSPQERCLVFGAGPPLLPGPYNNNIQIVQTPSNVVIVNEMIHDARVVPVDGRPHLPAAIRPWLGDSRGHWNGDTLVIETTNFSARTSFRGSDENLRVVERFSLAGANSLQYEFTIDDPSAFATQWTAAFRMARSPEPMYEYACHEGNYGLLDILRGARFEERSGGASASAPR